jgi:hypothetical protein
VAGRNNYLDDVLTLAGGENAVRPGSAAYPQLDREMLLALDPEVIFQLLPGATPQVRAAAQRRWRSMPQLRAVRDHRVHLVTEPWCLMPTQRVAELAEIFARGLHEGRVGATQASPVSPARKANEGDAGSPPAAREPAPTSGPSSHSPAPAAGGARP